MQLVFILMFVLAFVFVIAIHNCYYCMVNGAGGNYISSPSLSFIHTNANKKMKNKD